MNTELNLVEILKDCPIGTALYSTVYGEVKLHGIKNDPYPIVFKFRRTDKSKGYYNTTSVAVDGRLSIYCNGECTLFPSKDQRDWSKFEPKQVDEDISQLISYQVIISIPILKKIDVIYKYMERVRNDEVDDTFREYIEREVSVVSKDIDNFIYTLWDDMRERIPQVLMDVAKYASHNPVDD